MPSKPIRAIYRDGVLYPLEPVDLKEGEIVWLLIIRDEERGQGASVIPGVESELLVDEEPHGKADEADSA